MPFITTHANSESEFQIRKFFVCSIQVLKILIATFVSGFDSLVSFLIGAYDEFHSRVVYVSRSKCVFDSLSDLRIDDLNIF